MGDESRSELRLLCADATVILKSLTMPYFDRTYPELVTAVVRLLQTGTVDAHSVASFCNHLERVWESVDVAYNAEQVPPDDASRAVSYSVGAIDGLRSIAQCEQLARHTRRWRAVLASNDVPDDWHYCHEYDDCAHIDALKKSDCIFTHVNVEDRPWLVCNKEYKRQLMSAYLLVSNCRAGVGMLKGLALMPSRDAQDLLNSGRGVAKTHLSAWALSVCMDGVKLALGRETATTLFNVPRPSTSPGFLLKSSANSTWVWMHAVCVLLFTGASMPSHKKEEHAQDRSLDELGSCLGANDRTGGATGNLHPKTRTARITEFVSRWLHDALHVPNSHSTLNAMFDSKILEFDATGMPSQCKIRDIIDEGAGTRLSVWEAVGILCNAAAGLSTPFSFHASALVVASSLVGDLMASGMQGPFRICSDVARRAATIAASHIRKAGQASVEDSIAVYEMLKANGRYAEPEAGVGKYCKRSRADRDTETTSGRRARKDKSPLLAARLNAAMHHLSVQAAIHACCGASRPTQGHRAAQQTNVLATLSSPTCLAGVPSSKDAWALYSACQIGAWAAAALQKNVPALYGATLPPFLAIPVLRRSRLSCCAAGCALGDTFFEYATQHACAKYGDEWFTGRVRTLHSTERVFYYMLDEVESIFCDHLRLPSDMTSLRGSQARVSLCAIACYPVFARHCYELVKESGCCWRGVLAWLPAQSKHDNGYMAVEDE